MKKLNILVLVVLILLFILVGIQLYFNATPQTEGVLSVLLVLSGVATLFVYSFIRNSVKENKSNKNNLI